MSIRSWLMRFLPRREYRVTLLTEKGGEQTYGVLGRTKKEARSHALAKRARFNRALRKGAEEIGVTCSPARRATVLSVERFTPTKF